MVSAQEWLHSWKYRRSRSRVLACIVMFYIQCLISIGLKLPIEFLLLVGVTTYIAVWIAREGVTKKEIAYHVLTITLVSATAACVRIFNVNYWVAVGTLLVVVAIAGVKNHILKKKKGEGGCHE